jgi:hypothetical protein
MANANSRAYLEDKKNWVPGPNGPIPPDQVRVNATGVRRAMMDAEAKSRPNGQRFPLAADAVDEVNDEVRRRLNQPGPMISPAAPSGPISPITGQPSGFSPAQFAMGPAHTVAGMDEAKQAVNNLIYTQGVAKQGTKSRAFVAPVRDAIKQAIVDAAPGYAKAMERSQNALETLKEIRSGMSLTDKASIDTALSKLMSSAKSDVSGRFGFRKAMVDELSKYKPEVRASVAGATSNSWMPRGPVGKLLSASSVKGGVGAGAVIAPVLAGLKLAALAPIASPKINAGLRYGAGRAARVASPTSDALTRALLYSSERGQGQ